MSAWHNEWNDPAGNMQGGGMAGFGGSVPLWTKRILITNGLIFLVMFMLGNAGYSLSNVLAVNSEMWWTKAPFFPFWQVLTYGFVHDLGGFSHILFNSLSLFFFGSMVERALGSKKMLTIYLGAILLGGILRAALCHVPALEGTVVGASGGVMGIMVAAAMLFPHSKLLLLFIPVPLYVGVSIMVVMDLLMMARVGGGVAHDVHLAGALFGFLFIKMAWHKRADLALFNVGSAIADRRDQHVASKTQADEDRLDRLLARISQEGINSLSKSEKDFLTRMSKRP